MLLFGFLGGVAWFLFPLDLTFLHHEAVIGYNQFWQTAAAPQILQGHAWGLQWCRTLADKTGR